MSFKGSTENSNSIPEDNKTIGDSESQMNFWKALKSGFLTNALNPKATLFILAVFTQVIDPLTPKWIETIYGLEMIGATALWFCIVALCLSTDYFARKIQSAKAAIDKVTGLVLTALGVKILLE
jgi:threonine/homoserine/homoserine lactone efflux protein